MRALPAAAYTTLHHLTAVFCSSLSLNTAVDASSGVMYTNWYLPGEGEVQGKDGRAHASEQA